MKLYISTASHSKIILKLYSGKNILARKEIEAAHRQAEKLLPSLEAMLKKAKKKLSDIKEIIIENKGEGFTALRVGVTTANALAYALGIALATPQEGRVKVARPQYAQGASITKKKSN